MKKKARPNYGQYVHPFETAAGLVRFAVARWDPDRNQFIRPFDRTENGLTGCSAEFTKKASAMQNFPTYEQAVRRARYLFGPESERHGLL